MFFITITRKSTTTTYYILKKCSDKIKRVSFKFKNYETETIENVRGEVYILKMRTLKI